MPFVQIMQELRTVEDEGVQYWGISQSRRTFPENLIQAHVNDRLHSDVLFRPDAHRYILG